MTLGAAGGHHRHRASRITNQYDAGKYAVAKAACLPPIMTTSIGVQRRFSYGGPCVSTEGVSICP